MSIDECRPYVLTQSIWVRLWLFPYPRYTIDYLTEMTRLSRTGWRYFKKKGSVPLTYSPKPAGKYHSELDYRFCLGNFLKKVIDLRKLVAG